MNRPSLRRRWLALALAAVAGLGGGGAALAQAVSVSDDRGHRLKLAAPPQRIVSLLPSLTEAVCALDACARLVGVDRWSNHPASVTALPRLGGIDNTPVEAVLALAPDVVLAAPSTRLAERLRALGLNVLVFDSDRHEQVQRSLLVLATLLGEPARGERAWAQIQAQIAAARSRLPVEVAGQSVYFEIGSAPHAAGEASFLGQTLAALGLANIVPAALGPFPQINPEHVVRSQPRWVLAPAREIAAMPRRPGWDTLAALREGRYCAFTPEQYELLIRPGPRLGEGAALIAGCLVERSNGATGALPKVAAASSR
jgi:iron complex transport system substrate-binding protein